MSDFEPGSVWLVGAGPGDPELLTRKAERLLQSASIVFYDALVGKRILELIPARARQVPVGKRSGRHSRDQASINALLVDAALAGERVVRLKGGDPSIFGRADEELKACHIAQVPVHICPGITAASAAAAQISQSLTLRGTARRLIFVTAHTRAGQLPDPDWASLADPQAVLAIYMGKAGASHVSSGLMKAGLPGDTPVVLVENASLPGSRSFHSRLDLLPIASRTALGSGPAIILIGEALRREAAHEANSAPDRRPMKIVRPVPIATGNPVPRN